MSLVLIVWVGPKVNGLDLGSGIKLMGLNKKFGGLLDMLLNLI